MVCTPPPAEDGGRYSTLKRETPFLILGLYLLARLLPLPLTANETDVLPFARALLQPSWIEGDWYLSRSIPYRLAFNLLAGPLAIASGVEVAARLGRALAVIIFVLLIRLFCRTFRLSSWLVLPAGLVYFQRQSLGAGEWILWGFEAKVVAYLLALFAVSDLYLRHYRRAALLLGLAVSFHVLVGIYATFCTLCAALACQTRNEWRRALRRSWPYLPASVFGVWAVIHQLAQRWHLPSAEAAQAAVTYVTLRLPHHLHPPQWQPPGLWVGLALFWTALLLLARLHGGARVRFLSQYALAAIALFAVGLGLFAAGRTSALVYYWFRFGDTIVPLVGLLVVAMLLDPMLRGLGPRQRTLLAFGSVAIVGISLFHVEGVYGGLRSAGFPPTVPPPSQSEREAARAGAAMAWIRRSTPRSARFLIDPRLEHFYVLGERPVFVTWKHFPQDAGDINEWLARMNKANRLFPGRVGRYLRGHADPRSAPELDAFAADGVDFALLPANTSRTDAIYRDPQWMVVPVLGRARPRSGAANPSAM